MRYLIAHSDDDAPALGRILEERGTLVSRVRGLEDMSAFLEVAPLDLLILDAALLQHTPWRLRALRRRWPELPIAMIEAAPDHDHIGAWFAAGADTVLPEKSPDEELVARAMAVARRAHQVTSAHLQLGDLVLDLDARRARVCGHDLNLTPKAYEVLEYLALRPGRLVSRDTLLMHLYGLEDEPESRVFDVYVHALRSALRKTKGALSIVTERGSGVRLVVAPAGAHFG